MVVVFVLLLNGVFIILTCNRCDCFYNTVFIGLVFVDIATHFVVIIAVYNVVVLVCDISNYG